MKISTVAHSNQPDGRLEQIGSETKFVTFFVGSLFLGVDVLKVQEVLRSQEMTQVPLAPRFVRGLINLRGQIVTAIDMRERLNLAPNDAGARPMHVVVRSEESAVSLLVDDIGEVLSIDPCSFEAPPVNMPAGQRSLINGVYKVHERLLLVLNTDRTLELPVGA